MKGGRSKRCDERRTNQTYQEAKPTPCPQQPNMQGTIIKRRYLRAQKKDEPQQRDQCLTSEWGIPTRPRPARKDYLRRRRTVQPYSRRTHGSTHCVDSHTQKYTDKDVPHHTAQHGTAHVSAHLHSHTQSRTRSAKNSLLRPPVQVESK
jgi:hypothetical protein